MKKAILAIGIVALFIGVSSLPAGAGFNNTSSIPVEQNEPLADGLWSLYGHIWGLFEVQEIISAKRIGNLYFNVEVKGHCYYTFHDWENYPKEPFKIYHGKIFESTAMSGNDITLKVAVLINSPELIEGEFVEFGRYSKTIGIGIRWKAEDW